MSHEDKGLDSTREQFHGIYRGIVRNSFDPNEKGMVQIEVLPMMKGIATTDLPFAEPKWPLNVVQIPQEGAAVWVQFEGGDLYKPIYESMALPIQKINGQDVSLSGNHNWKSTDAGDYAKAVVAANAAASAVGGSSSPAYPYRTIFVSPGGIVIEIDDTPNNQRILVYHPVGTGIQLDKDTLIVKSAKPLSIEVDGDVEVTASGDATIDATKINLGEGAAGKIVTTESICAFTGINHPDGSDIGFCKKA